MRYAHVKSARSASSLSLDVLTIAHIAALEMSDFPVRYMALQYVQGRGAHQKTQSKLGFGLHLKFPERKCRYDREEDICECRIRCSE